MKKSIVIVLAIAFVAFAGSTAMAATIAIGSVTGGTGTVSISGGSPTGWDFSGLFSFENTVPYGGFTLAQIFGDVGQFTFAASSLANLPAYDSNGGSDPGVIYRGSVGWLINNPGGPNATIYGSTGGFAFSGAYPTGTVTATLYTDGFIHWYYGYDDTIGPPAGKTSLAALGLTNPLLFSGVYNITGDTGNTITFNLTGDITTQVPEPSLMLLFGIGLGAAGLLVSCRKR